MLVTFGLQLDGSVAPDTLGGRSASLGETVCGPERLLCLLECHLGLGGDWKPEPVRVLEYRSRLAAADNGRRFYTQSYRRDPLGTATTLLRWREELIAGGWDGSLPATQAARLADLAAVEAGGPLLASPASRLRSVMSALRRRRAPFAAIRLIDPLDLLPPPWPDLLELLEGQGCELELADDFPAGGDSNLDILRAALSREPTHPPVEADGSVLILRAGSDTEAAEAVARWLDENGAGAALIAPAGDDALDRALGRHGMPVTGARPMSAWRPALQILPLAVALRWEPLDPRRLLEFLLVPAGPLSRFVATTLARAVARQPGIGGVEWRKALHRIEQAHLEDWNEQSSLIQSWLLAPRADPVQGLPRRELLDICARVAEWAQARLALDREDDVAGASLGQALTMRGMLDLLEEQNVPQLLWNALLEQATGSGVPLPRAHAQAGSVPVAHHPGAVIAPVEKLVWWDFTGETVAKPVFNPWTFQERAALERAGVTLEEPARAIEREAEAAARAIRSATGQLVLVIPAVRRGEPSSTHPELARISSALGPVLAACAVDARGGDPVQAAALPARRRWWQLPDGLPLEGREVDSYTSLSDFINHPFHWVLKYPAELSAGALQPILPTHRLLGDLAHRLVQDCLQRPDLRGLHQFIEDRLSRLLEEEGAVLLLPARQPDRRRLAAAVERSVSVLWSKMREGGWRLDPTVGRRNLPGVEISCESQFLGGSLIGYLDVLLVNENDERLVLDMKWRRPSSGPEVPMQLLVYAHLIRSRTGRWPRIAHFFLEQGSLFPADALDAGGGRAEWTEADCAAQWPAVEAAWQWRRQQLDRGLVEVSADGTAPDERSAPPAGAREPEETCRFNEFETLVGWTLPAVEGDE